MPTLTKRPYKIPKYQQLAAEIRQQIVEGVLPPGEQLPSFPRLRALHGITNSTVEKVYEVLERDGLIVRRPRRGTFVAQRDSQFHITSGEKTGKQQGTIGVSGLGFSFAGSSSYWGRMLQGIREASEPGESQIMLLPHDSFKGWEKADGVLLCDWVLPEIVENLPPGLPHVFLVSRIPEMAGVSADDYSGGRLATEHLLELGHRRIAYVHSNDPVLIPQRQAGYEDALKAVGIVPEKQWVRQLSRIHDFDYGADFVSIGRTSINLWLREGWRESGCSALLAHNDETAIGAIEAFHAVGLKVPDDVSVIGFDGVEIGAYSSPRLTTIEVPLRRIGQVATELLLRQMGSDFKNTSREFEHRVLPVQLKMRESTAPPPRF